ncbi:MAG TPA: hypothetical protein VGS57_20625 [Thermoanaerobaculia bacterium]|jgi:anti-sigma factor RsiW|nr:hypothetical protein [Thermoanaerobaculia bacterium]
MRDRAADRRLMRYLHGELPSKDVRELRAELAKDPALQARLAELHRLWQGLQPSPPTPAPFGYVPKIQRLADQQRATGATRIGGWRAAPSWGAPLAAAALVAGVTLGVGLGRMPQRAESTVAQGNGAAATVAASPAAAISARDGVGASAAPSPTAESEMTAGVTASPSPAVANATPRGTASAAAEHGSAPTPSTTEVAAAMGGDETAALAGGGSTTFAEEYWQALEGLDGSDDGGGGGGEGDAGR